MDQPTSPKALLSEAELIGFALDGHTGKQVVRRASSAKVTVEPVSPRALLAEQELIGFSPSTSNDEKTVRRAAGAKVGPE